MACVAGRVREDTMLFSGNAAMGFSNPTWFMQSSRSDERSKEIAGPPFLQVQFPHNDSFPHFAFYGFGSIS